jgi:hypothetical protein
MANVPWTNDELLQQAQGNANAVTAATLLYVRENGRSIEHFAAFIGDTFAAGWTELQGAGALEVARVTAFNPVSLGATLVSLDGDDHHAFATVDVSPMVDDATAFGVSVDDLATMWRVFMERVADRIGIRFAFDRDGNQWTFELTH